MAAMISKPLLLTFTATTQNPGIIIKIIRFDPSKISDRISFPLKDTMFVSRWPNIDKPNNMELLAQFLSFDNLLESVLAVSGN